MKKQIKFPDDFEQRAHPVIPMAKQWRWPNWDDTKISIVGGGTGLYGDGKRTFEMWDYDEEQPRGYMTATEINEYLVTKEIFTNL